LIFLIEVRVLGLYGSAKSCRDDVQFYSNQAVSQISQSNAMSNLDIPGLYTCPKQLMTITRQDRERLNGHHGRVIWFTGLSGAGKSTLANALEVELHSLGQRTYLLDGDNVRQGLNKDLDFSDIGRVENIRRIAEVAKLMMDAGLMVMTAFISPFRRDRALARELIGAENFVEVYVSTSLEVCEQRDVKGLYKKARNGLLPNMTGVNSPYEGPERPDIDLDCANVTVGAAITRIRSLILPSNPPKPRPDSAQPNGLN